MSIPLDGPRLFGHGAQPALAVIMAAMLRVRGVATPWALALTGSLLALHVGVSTARRWPLPSLRSVPAGEAWAWWL